MSDSPNLSKSRNSFSDNINCSTITGANIKIKKISMGKSTTGGETFGPTNRMTLVPSSIRGKRKDSRPSLGRESILPRKEEMAMMMRVATVSSLLAIPNHINNENEAYATTAHQASIGQQEVYHESRCEARRQVASALGD